jgi:hypothetical protein
MKPLYPRTQTIRSIRVPLSPKSLAPLEPTCRRVILKDKLADKDLKSLAALLKKHPEVALSVRSRDDEPPFKNLDFLAHFPTLRHLEIAIPELEDISGLERLPSDLVSLTLGGTKKKFSLASLTRFAALEALSLSGPVEDIEVIGKLTKLGRLGLGSIPLPNLKALLPLRQLEILYLSGSEACDLRELPEIGRLHTFEPSGLDQLSDLGPVVAIPTLECLHALNLPRVTKLPSFAKAQALVWVFFQGLHGLQDLAPLAEAPRLRTLQVYDMAQLSAEAFRPFAGHPSLKDAEILIGTEEKVAAVKSMLGVGQSGALPERYQW